MILSLKIARGIPRLYLIERALGIAQIWSCYFTITLAPPSGIYQVSRQVANDQTSNAQVMIIAPVTLRALIISCCYSISSCTIYSHWHNFMSVLVCRLGDTCSGRTYRSVAQQPGSLITRRRPPRA
ncbi:hypothetical protein B0T22DRAFT_471770 [Podospora appendiculata]|uniref:Uncharacterized protein n=1 Tax=Podospora appendiculata TaxID=314037 RepID=A0AAE0X1F3_9PEZI|nr:hypothetical protein B0T22DRAFT_471770 [Podospora appendiculata]